MNLRLYDQRFTAVKQSSLNYERVSHNYETHVSQLRDD